MTMHGVATALLILAFLQALAFVLRYLLTDWFRYQMGRHAMAFMAACALTLSLGLVREFAPGWIDLETARVVSFVLVNVVFAQRLWLLFVGQRPKRVTLERDDEEAPR
jgi:hypothetical protein